MIIFVNDIPVRILKGDDDAPHAGKVNHAIDASVEDITPAKLINHVWVKNVSELHLDHLLEFLNSKVPTNLLSLAITPLHYRILKSHLKNKFKIVKAAGGVIRKKDKFLMIYRMKKWDLPKGKKEKKENYQQTAVREVAEECNVAVKLGKKICTTWHTYTMNKSPMIKKTKWYVMDIVDDTRMKPCLEEDIEEVRWMNGKEVYHALEHSYKSISFVFEKYYDMIEIKTNKG